MTLRSRLVLASALALGVIGFQAGTASAQPTLAIDTHLAAPGDAHIDNVRYYCNWGGCGHRYGYRYYGYGYRPWGYAYHPYGYGYRYVTPGIRLGFY